MSLFPKDCTKSWGHNWGGFFDTNDKSFRRDLYYRLNVFPIRIPPLRERGEDIPLLAKHFTRIFAKKMNRDISSISSETLRVLSSLPWPGNIRELKNVIERAVIMTYGSVLHLPISELQEYFPEVESTSFSVNDDPQTRSGFCCTESVGQKEQACSNTDRSAMSSKKSLECEQIIQVLKETNGIVAGPRGAAQRLGLKRTTLLSRMQRLGITSNDYA
uniref:Sigma-54 factor interaction domain-containing protein n=1 Tax=Vibrio algicola TaxID=2662262 RepID=A0A5Q0TNL3_9VIBR|nr:helix-turn-helix domain-containing protein [Vibrio algicola]